MGLLDRFRRQKNTTDDIQVGKKNAINNRKLKDALSTTAMSLLVQGEDYSSTENIFADFGYLFEFDAHGIEALLKITTDKGIIYFAAQKNSLIRLNFNEDMFKDTCERFLEIHDKGNLIATDEAENRKLRSIEILKENSIKYLNHLPIIESSSDITVKSNKEIAERAVCCLLSIQHSFDVINNNDIEASHEFAYGLLENWKLTDKLTENEQKLFANTLDSEKLNAFPWRYEAYWVLVWALGFVEILDMPIHICDCKEAIRIVNSKNSFAEFLSDIKPKEVSEILDEADLIYRIHWAVVDARLNKQEPPANLDPSVVLERHMALNWLIGYDDDWDNTSIST